MSNPVYVRDRDVHNDLVTINILIEFARAHFVGK